MVFLEEYNSDIVMVKMEDRESKNTLSNAILDGLITSFEEIEKRDCYKVVILTGYDSYFCSGGTQQNLLAIQSGEAKFTDGRKDVFSLPLECKVPVISAMQGHAIGGGFALGMFADLAVLGRECIYTTNFMKYGFTPGMGATFILPRKLGIGLAEEMMLQARNYRGEELERRGIPFPVVPKKQVMEYAINVAKEIAEKPRLSLITLKDNLVENLRNELDKAIEKELIMHDLTFHQDEVRERILQLFGK